LLGWVSILRDGPILGFLQFYFEKWDDNDCINKKHFFIESFNWLI
jgi:hypothetical protein